MKKQEAFTLMEIMVVIVLIGLIAAFALPNYTKSVRRAHERDATVQLTALHAGNEVYFAKEKEYLDTGTGDLTQVNSGLNLNLVANNMVYTYTSPATNAYTATALWAEGATNIFTIRVTEIAIDTANPCCFGGTCPSLAACP